MLCLLSGGPSGGPRGREEGGVRPEAFTTVPRARRDPKPFFHVFFGSTGVLRGVSGSPRGKEGSAQLPPPLWQIGYADC